MGRIDGAAAVNAAVERELAGRESGAKIRTGEVGDRVAADVAGQLS